MAEAVRDRLNHEIRDTIREPAIGGEMMKFDMRFSKNEMLLLCI